MIGLLVLQLALSAPSLADETKPEKRFVVPVVLYATDQKSCADKLRRLPEVGARVNAQTDEDGFIREWCAAQFPQVEQAPSSTVKGGSESLCELVVTDAHGRESHLPSSGVSKQDCAATCERYRATEHAECRWYSAEEMEVRKLMPPDPLERKPAGER